LALKGLDEKRMEVFGDEASTSAKLTHNVALNRVFDEAVIRGFLTEANQPAGKSKKARYAGHVLSQRRARATARL
jgi:hypothetical protein